MKPPESILRLVAAQLESRQLKAHRHAAIAQEALLQKIIKRYRATDIGKSLGLDRIRSAAQFHQQIPTLEASDYGPWWERALNENPAGLVHPRKLQYMAKSSGTTGKIKHIPFPAEQLASFRTFTNHGFFHAFKELNDYSLLNQNILVTSALSLEQRPAVGITLGFGSGLAALNPSRFAKNLVRPTADIVAMTNASEKIRRTLEQAIKLDIRVMTGIPLPILRLLENLIDYANEHGIPATTAKDIWPGLRVYAYSGTSLSFFEKKIRKLLGEGVETFEVYSASEAPVAYQFKFGEPGLLVDMLTTYYEFEPVDEAEKNRLGRRLGIHEVDIGVEYEIVVTTIGGLFAYKLGDRIEFLSKSPYTLRFSGRAREEINVCNERLRLDRAKAVLDMTCSQMDASYSNFLLCPGLATDNVRETFSHQWCIEFDRPPGDEAQFLVLLDKNLQEHHDVYKWYRQGSGVFKSPTLYVLSRGTVDHYARDHLVFGQGKLVNLHNDRIIPDKMIALDKRLRAISEQA